MNEKNKINICKKPPAGDISYQFTQGVGKISPAGGLGLIRKMVGTYE